MSREATSSLKILRREVVLLSDGDTGACTFLCISKVSWLYIAWMVQGKYIILKHNKLKDFLNGFCIFAM